MSGEPVSFDHGLRQLPGAVVIAIGADVIEIDRVRQAVSRQPRFIDRVFTPGEQAYCKKHRDPAERYAVRFAAKEAVLKALGVGLGGADFADIEIERHKSGRPSLVLTGRASDLAEELGIKKWLVTLSHADTVAQAFVAGLGEDQNMSVM